VRKEVREKRKEERRIRWSDPGTVSFLFSLASFLV